MLTNLTEKMKVKCSQYWPDSGSTQYNNIEVTLVNAVTHADYIIRQFHIKEVSTILSYNVSLCVYMKKLSHLFYGMVFILSLNADVLNHVTIPQPISNRGYSVTNMK